MALWPAIVAITAITALFIAGLVFALYRWLTAKEFPKKPVRQALILELEATILDCAAKELSHGQANAR